MSKTILAKVDGWTPAIDSITSKHGVIASIVFGRIWRYCQGSEGACTASLETIADELGLSRRTVIRKVAELVADGYLKDETPGRRHAPHRYFDTGKAGLEIAVGVTESPLGVTESHTRCDRESLIGVTESHLKRQYKKESKKESREGVGEFSGRIFTLYETSIGGIVPPALMQEMAEAETEYPAEWLDAAFPAEWLDAAFGIAARNNKRSWQYVRGILRRYTQQGFTPPDAAQPGNGNKPGERSAWDGVRASNV